MAVYNYVLLSVIFKPLQDTLEIFTDRIESNIDVPCDRQG